MNLQIPLDFERLPEFWQLKAALTTRRPLTPALSTDGERVAAAQLNSAALELFLRLWVVLGYLARHTNRPGWLNTIGESQLVDALPQFGDDCPPVDLLEGNLLRKVDDGWMCDLFAGANKHLAGNYVSKEARGNMRSRMSAAKTGIAAEALHQGNLLPPTVYKKRDGSDMDERSRQRCVVIIMTLDRCLNPAGFKPVPRSVHSYTEGLMADACAVFETVTAEELQEVYEWLAAHKGQPQTPTTTEDVLRNWDVVWRASKL